MKDLYKMTKEELILECRRLRSENERLQDELDRLSDCYTEMENQLANTINDLDSTDMIYDVDWFKFRLSDCGLMTPQMEEFIDYYLKFHNVRG